MLHRPLRTEYISKPSGNEKVSSAIIAMEAKTAILTSDFEAGIILLSFMIVCAPMRISSKASSPTRARTIVHYFAGVECRR